MPLLDRLYISLRMFWALLAFAPPLRARQLLPGVILMTVSIGLAHGAQGFTPGQNFALAFGAALIVRLMLRLPETLARLRPVVGSGLSAAVVYLSFAPILLILWGQDVLWCQRLATVMNLGWVLVYMTDVMGNRSLMTRMIWPDRTMADHLPALTRVMVLLHMSCALLNETMILALQPEVWMLYWALAPMLMHYARHALVQTVRMGAQA